MVKIYLLRHGEVQSNATGQLSVDTHEPLTATGIKQAQQTAENMASLGITDIYCSPLPRAIQTAQLISSSCGINIEIVPELAEGHMMLLDGKIKEQEPEYIDCPILGKIPIEDETDAQFHSRAVAAWKILNAPQTDRTLCVVTHGHMIRELINQAINSSKTIRFPHGNCHCTLIEINKDVIIHFTNFDMTTQNLNT